MTHNTSIRPRRPCDLILALDLPSKEEAMHMLDRIENRPHRVKIGLQLFTRYGPGLLDALENRGCQVFLDLKLHDIPNTVGKAVESLSHWPIDILTVHASGGSEMIRAACEARNRVNPGMKIIPVTVLTSLNPSMMEAIGIQGSPVEAALRLTRLALGAGADGVVCSAHEVEDLRRDTGEEAVLVVPGIRPGGSEKGDQERVMTPTQAAQSGASCIVVGRPILQAPDPLAMYNAILEELQNPSQTSG